MGYMDKVHIEQREEHRLAKIEVRRLEALVNRLKVVIFTMIWLALVVVLLILAMGCGSTVEVICDYPIEVEDVVPPLGEPCFEYGRVSCGENAVLLCRGEHVIIRMPDPQTRWYPLLNCPGGCTTDPLVCH